MAAPLIEEFAMRLVEHVRDAALSSCDRQLDLSSRSPVGVRWREILRNERDVELVRTVIADCVDETIGYLLVAIDQGLLHLSYTDASGERVDLSEEGLGGLSGWYMGSDGWRQRYSRERFVDDFSEMGPP